ncbi:site-specific integrase [Oxalobacteraceae bacterium R-40]|uniref:Site-specific integrase n=1 Tax=Keguizhuia sedimenti TaxID=3064264 RepID=A0ABU1BII4_9BURK|nr:site-specific integrase [Oxalobacteraceae bacterium R-40]
MAQIRRRGPSQYQARVRIKGYPEVSKTFPTRQDAVAWASVRERKVLQGLSQAMQLADALTLNEALERYRQEVTPSKKGHAQETVRVRRWQKHALAGLPLSQLRGADLAEYRDDRAQEGVGANTIRLELALISHLYEVARKDWGLETLNNPVKVMRKPKLPRGRDRRLLPGEEEKLLSFCRTSANTVLETVIVLALETAMRRGEIVGLVWENINLDTRLVYLNDTKNGESRVVPLSRRAHALLNLLERDRGRLINLHPDNVTQAFIHACKACAIQGLRLHDLRHEATSRLFEKGFNMMEVATITGHKSLSMLKRYTHLKPADLLSRLG